MVDAAARDGINDAITVVARFANSRQLAVVHSAQSGVDLPLSAIALLRQLEGGEAYRLSELARRLQVALPPLSRQVRAMVEGGYVERRPDGQDARATLLAITTKGHDALTRFAEANRVLIDKALAGWTDDALLTLADQMQRLIRDLRRGHPDGQRTGA